MDVIRKFFELFLLFSFTSTFTTVIATDCAPEYCYSRCCTQDNQCARFIWSDSCYRADCSVLNCKFCCLNGRCADQGSCVQVSNETTLITIILIVLGLTCCGVIGIRYCIRRKRLAQQTASQMIGGQDGIQANNDNPRVQEESQRPLKEIVILTADLTNRNEGKNLINQQNAPMGEPISMSKIDVEMEENKIVTGVPVNNEGSG